MHLTTENSRTIRSNAIANAVQDHRAMQSYDDDALTDGAIECVDALGFGPEDSEAAIKLWIDA